MSGNAAPGWMPAFLRQEAAGGILLIIGAALAMAIANSSLAPAYNHALHAMAGPLSVAHWINDGLMAIFFLGVGLEVKREFVLGELSAPRSRLLPLLAAGMGMIVPAGLYLALAGGTAPQGWAIPAATDIAFAQAILLLAGRGCPPSLKIFLTTVAVVDDIGAIAIIAIAYTETIAIDMLLAASALTGVLALLNRRGVTRIWPYLLVGALLWIAVLLSGIHATVAGVVTALFIPATSPAGEAPLARLERAIHPWSSYAIVPIFGFANAGLSLAGLGLGALAAPIPLGIAAGLVLGKQIGVGTGTWAAIRLLGAARPQGATNLQLYGVTLIAGIGFTMSLFIGNLAFADPHQFDAAKLGVVAGSLLSALAGFAVLRLSSRRPLPLAPPAP